MKIKKYLYLTLFIIIVSNSFLGFSQEKPEDIALIDDAFENDFYEALKQRAIENYDRAIVSIEKCIEKEPNKPELYYELGKNLLDLKQYPQAEDAFMKAISLNPNERWYLNGLYDVYYTTNNYSKAIPVVQKLIAFDVNLKEDLVSLYMNTNQHDKALALLQDMEKTMIMSKSMQYYKLRLENQNKNNKPEVSKLDNEIKKNPKNEQHYIDLILFYTNNNQEEKAFETAKELEKNIPDSEWAQLSLFKFYIDEINGDKATESMYKIFRSDKIDNKIKHRVLNEFLVFTLNNTSYYNEIEKAVEYFTEDETVNVTKEIAKFYWNKNLLDKAQYYFEKSIKKDTNDFESIHFLLQVLVQQKKYESVAITSEKYIELYPTQPILYFYAGKAYNEINQNKKALDLLETGLDYIVENNSLQQSVLTEIVIAAKKTNQTAKQNKYEQMLKAN